MRRVRFATTGWMESPAYMLGRPHRTKLPVSVVVAICERDDGSVLLVDAGWSAETCRNPRNIGFYRRTLGVRVRPGQDIAAQMRHAGLDPSRVTTIVATHLHLDHSGGACDFPNAELIATHDEVTEAYRASFPYTYRKQDLECMQRLRLVRLEPKPRLGFSHSYEIDEEVTMLDAPGHTRGQCAVVVRDGSTLWIHGGDVAYSHRELHEATLSPLSRMMAHDPRAARIAQRRLLRCSQSHREVRLVLSHDAAAFERLPQLSQD